MTYIGIDPGKKGGFAFIFDRQGKQIAFPWDSGDFVQWMKEIKFGDSDCVACLEHVSAMPGQGVTSMFTFGENFGFIKGVLTAFGIPFELVRPQKWKKEFSITSDKNTSIEVCKRLFPDVSLLPSSLSKKDSDGMAEALLMAEYARRKFAR